MDILLFSISGFNKTYYLSLRARSHTHTRGHTSDYFLTKNLIRANEVEPALNNTLRTFMKVTHQVLKEREGVGHTEDQVFITVSGVC